VTPAHHSEPEGRTYGTASLYLCGGGIPHTPSATPVCARTPAIRIHGKRMSAAGHFHCQVKFVGRTNGRSIVAAAAYRSGERLCDEATATVADYTRRAGVLGSFTMARDNAPAYDRERAWNEAERADPRANARLATELELALPHELTGAQRHELLAGFVRKIVEKHGVFADVAIHAPGKEGDYRNIHAHVLLSHRELGPDGFGEIANRRTITRKHRGQTKDMTTAGIAATPADIRAIRKEWAQDVNRAYERAGLDIRVDERSHEDRGIAQEPTKHLGPTACAMERRGEPSDRGDVNRDIEQRNGDRQTSKALEAEARQIGAEIIDLEAVRAERAAHSAAQGRVDDIRPVPEAGREPERSSSARPAAETTPDPISAEFTAAARAAMQSEYEAARGRTDEIGPAAPARAQEGPDRDPGIEPPEPTVSRATGPESEPETALAREEPAHGIGGIIGGLADGAEKVLGKVLDVFAGMFESLFASPPPPPAPEEQRRAERVAEEQREQAAAEREAAEREARFQELLEQIRRDDAERERQSLAERFGRARDYDRDDDYDRGRERER
jgi:hypothetical protein